MGTYLHAIEYDASRSGPPPKGSTCLLSTDCVAQNAENSRIEPKRRKTGPFTPRRPAWPTLRGAVPSMP